MSTGKNRYNWHSPGYTGWTSMKNEEFQENDIWGALNEEIKEFDSRANSFQEPSFSTKCLPTAAKLIPRNSNSGEPDKTVQHSAPIRISDWSKVYGASPEKPSMNTGSIGRGFGRNDDDEEDEYDGNQMPPHEWIARKLARNRISSFSVCEGVGRTLKGRDLSRVRNAILTKTGFLE